jgi:hypothetical protein
MPKARKMSDQKSQRDSNITNITTQKLRIMNYQSIILKILCGRQSVICHKNALLQEFTERSSPSLALENWCFHHGIEMTHINGNLIRLSKKTISMMVYNSFLS